MLTSSPGSRLLASAAQNQGHRVTGSHVSTQVPPSKVALPRGGGSHLFLRTHLTLLLIFFLPRGSWVLCSVGLNQLIPQGQSQGCTEFSLHPLPWNVILVPLRQQDASKAVTAVTLTFFDDLFLKQKIMLRK